MEIRGTYTNLDIYYKSNTLNHGSVLLGVRDTIWNLRIHQSQTTKNSRKRQDNFYFQVSFYYAIN